jgi:hypothetical protein
MPSNLERFKKDLERLIETGDKMELDLTFRHQKDLGELSEAEQKALKKLDRTFERIYQSWYTESSSVIHQLIPERLLEFQQLYKGDGKRKVINSITYSVQDWLNGITSAINQFTGEKTFNDFAIVSMRFHTQLEILKSVKARFESSLFDIKQLVQADLFDSEIETARELLKHDFLRGSGAIAGVVLEKHLQQVANNHEIKTRKKNPSISDFNDLLKNAGTIDVPLWRQIQRLGDIRNLCDHNKEREPTKDEVEELINGVEKITKTLF